MTTLYRKYRPQKFADLTGQEVAVTTITNQLATNRVAHAYLFSGPRGVGKTTLARLLAKAVNCERRKAVEAEPCNACDSCTAITAGKHFDVVEMDAASHTQVDNVRENIIANLNVPPARGKFRVFIIDEAHMLSGSSFNALLKTLEEPPAHMIFILATTEPGKFPATVVSRCQRFQFKRIPAAIMRERLAALAKAEGVQVEREVLDRIIKKSDGCLRDAESLLGQVLSLNQKKISAADASLFLPPANLGAVLDYLEALARGEAGAALRIVADLFNQGASLEQFGEELLETLRLIMLVQIRPDSLEASDGGADAVSRLRALARTLPLPSLPALIELALNTKARERQTIAPTLPWELFAAEAALRLTAVGPALNANRPPPTDTAPVPLAPAAPLPKTEAKPAKDTPKKTPAPHHSTQPTTAIPPAISLEKIQNQWGAVIERVANSTPSLTVIMKTCQLAQVDEQGLHLTVPFRLHQEKIAELKNRQVLEASLRAVTGVALAVICRVAARGPRPAAPVPQPAAGPAPESSSPADLTGFALEFGGEVVS
ncbi:MAG: DNA polymerase III subunit gamma/tau [Candidatus Magasanikbacteria bacterium]|nr:DNA polymerase III subunit gamma/tau [Candidatus Magasanikbacteria bacterium]